MHLHIILQYICIIVNLFNIDTQIRALMIKVMVQGTSTNNHQEVVEGVVEVEVAEGLRGKIGIVETIGIGTEIEEVLETTMAEDVGVGRGGGGGFSDRFENRGGGGGGAFGPHSGAPGNYGPPAMPHQQTLPNVYGAPIAGPPDVAPVSMVVLR